MAKILNLILYPQSRAHLTSSHFSCSLQHLLSIRLLHTSNLHRAALSRFFLFSLLHPQTHLHLHIPVPRPQPQFCPLLTHPPVLQPPAPWHLATSIICSQSESFTSPSLGLLHLFNRIPCLSLSHLGPGVGRGNLPFFPFSLSSFLKPSLQSSLLLIYPFDFDQCPPTPIHVLPRKFSM